MPTPPPPYPTFALNDAPPAPSLNALFQDAHLKDQVFEIYPGTEIRNPSDAFADLWHFPDTIDRHQNFYPGPLYSAPVKVRAMAESLLHPPSGYVFDRTGRVMAETTVAEYFRSKSWTRTEPLAEAGTTLAAEMSAKPKPQTPPIRTLYANHGGYTVFGHYMFETLPMALIFAQALRAGQMKLLMPHPESKGTIAMAARTGGLLNLIGLPPTVEVRQKEPFVWRRGVIVASSCSGGPTFAPGPMHHALARTIKATTRHSRGTRRLFITRTGEDTTQRRDLVNEIELIAALEPLGFEAVNPGLLPPREQVALFAQAECLVAVMGSVWANLIYTSPGTLVVDLLPEHKAATRDPFGINTAKAMALPYILILTPSQGARVGDLDVIADVPLVVDRVKRGLARQKDMGFR